MIAIQRGQATPELVEAASDMNVTDKKGYSLLHYAATHPKMDESLIKVLILKGVNPDARDVRGDTAIHSATIFNRYE